MVVTEHELFTQCELKKICSDLQLQCAHSENSPTAQHVLTFIKPALSIFVGYNVKPSKCDDNSDMQHPASALKNLDLCHHLLSG